ncbi:hypothetical protein PGTUg99_007307 [Puccinia graminis f. sp. tritici]|uniref:Uncharacterized protein n=1 Tax=Puccinia graminis f. sp. tritici TaxID=56615 RepID=A0A5B0M9K6_PUCGR|nr:hypothetical protein PGTUg99_007307 [Puccinia graminis f. sp. tritici]
MSSYDEGLLIQLVVVIRPLGMAAGRLTQQMCVINRGPSRLYARASNPTAANMYAWVESPIENVAEQFADRREFKENGHRQSDDPNIVRADRRKSIDLSFPRAATEPEQILAGVAWDVNPRLINSVALFGSHAPWILCGSSTPGNEA